MRWNVVGNFDFYKRRSSSRGSEKWTKKWTVFAPKLDHFCTVHLPVFRMLIGGTFLHKLLVFNKLRILEVRRLPVNAVNLLCREFRLMEPNRSLICNRLRAIASGQFIGFTNAEVVVKMSMNYGHTQGVLVTMGKVTKGWGSVNGKGWKVIKTPESPEGTEVGERGL